MAYNEIGAALLEGHSPVQAIDADRQLDLDSDTRSALETPATVPVEQLSTGGYMIDSLACAVWAIQQPESLESVLVDLVNRGDDADTTCAIAGGLLGVIHGADAIPSRWLDKLEYADKMIAAATELARLRSAA
ncbi:ADP-ribosylglycohydrolase family protein [Candidatus Poriferisodalis sp.]|uniref:ADP-ribosylglycohydrolase family protein n=1 Tax=Candidatus Poriferisodalis sp. TaxID=3101277 RepID=UPI003B51E06C